MEKKYCINCAFYKYYEGGTMAWCTHPKNVRISLINGQTFSILGVAELRHSSFKGKGLEVCGEAGDWFMPKPTSIPKKNWFQKLFS